MKTPAKMVLKYVLSFSVAALLLYLSFSKIDWSHFLGGLRGVKPGPIALFFVFSACAFLLRSLRWKLMLNPIGPQISFLQTFSAVGTGNLSNCAVPFSGEFVRCGIMGSFRGAPGYDRILGTIATERAWDFLSILSIAVAVVLARSRTLGAFFSEHIVGPVLGRVAGGGWIVLLAFIFLCAAAIATVASLREKSRFCGKLWDVMKGMLQGVAACLKMKNKGLFLALTVLIWGSYFAMSLCIAHSIPEFAALCAADILFIMAVGNFASVVPVPGGFGAYHYIVALCVSSLFALGWDSGMLFATLSHECQVLSIIFWGIVSVLVRRRISQRP